MSCAYLFKAPDLSVCFVGSVMQNSTLETFVVRKNTCNCVTESEMVNSVSVKQAYPLSALLICIDKVHTYTDLCVYEQDFSGDLTWFILIRLDRGVITPRNMSASTWGTMILITVFPKFEIQI